MSNLKDQKCFKCGQSHAGPCPGAGGGGDDASEKEQLLEKAASNDIKDTTAKSRATPSIEGKQFTLPQFDQLDHQKPHVRDSQVKDKSAGEAKREHSNETQSQEDTQKSNRSGFRTPFNTKPNPRPDK